jgi:uncharacterized protein YceK
MNYIILISMLLVALSGCGDVSEHYLTPRPVNTDGERECK